MNGASSGGVADNTGASYAITSGGAGAFTAGAVGVSGSSGNAAFTVSAANSSALGVAQSINAVTSSTNVSAAADTSVAFTVTAGSFSFHLGNGTGAAQTNIAQITATVTSVTQSGLANLVNAINQNTGTTGITATVNSANKLVLTHAQGDNISVAAFSGTGTLAAGGTSTVTVAPAGTTTATVQGLVRQSNQSRARGSGARSTCSPIEPSAVVGQCQHGGKATSASIVNYVAAAEGGGQLG